MTRMIMTADYVIAAFALIAMGVVLGAVAVICIGIRREEKAMSLARSAPGRMANGARAFNGLHTGGRSVSGERGVIP
jgi:hypothetical protein